MNNLQKPLRPTYVKIHLDHIAKNFEIFKGLPTAQNFLCPMVKANAYGHGDIMVTQKLLAAGCKHFGVGLVEEGLNLRNAGIARPEILVFGFTGKEAVEEMLRAHLIPVVSDWQQLETLKDVVAKTSTQTKQRVHLKINTGMNRLGFSEDDVPKLAEALKQSPQFEVVGCGTHLATSEDLESDKGSAFAQLTSFARLLQMLPVKNALIHAYNTGGAAHMSRSDVLASQFPFGLRIGLGTYGYSPVSMDQSLKLYPAMSFLSRIVTVQNVKKNGRVSYGGTWVAEQDTKVGVVPAGYADGIPTQLSNKGFVQVGSTQAPIIGRVCMDYTLVDVTHVQNALGQDVEFFGTQLSATTVAEKAGTHTYDILTRISERVPRLYFAE